MPALSKRLSLIASFVPQDALVCDIGTDHGYLAIALIESGKAKKVIAADIAEKPLANAVKNIEKANVTGISLRLCNGLSAIKPEETDTIIIAGMGGEVISDILEKGHNVAKSAKVSIILQPTTSPEHLRRFLYENGYEIIREEAVFENNKLYSVMLVKFTGANQKCEDHFYYIGKLLPCDEASRLYIEKQQKRAEKCKISLENIKEKETDYLHYKSVLNGISLFLKTFNGENSNGV